MSMACSTSRITLSRRNTLGALVFSSSILRKEQVSALPVRNTSLKFSLDKPDGWQETSKAGANILYADTRVPSTTGGVVVAPVRGVSSLAEFGSLDTVCDKLLTTERNKDGFESLTVYQKKEREGNSGVSLYTIDYGLMTSRGEKRVLSTVSIANGQLYIFNITAKPNKYTEEEWEAEVQQLTAVADSFDVFT